MLYSILYSCISHRGKVRGSNQDNFLCEGHLLNSDSKDMLLPLRGTVSSASPHMFAIFDGMGGEECGDMAAYIAAETASGWEIKKNHIQSLMDYCGNANAAICRYAETHGIASMGTTAAILLFTKQGILLCNIGDSKIFRCSTSGIRQISKDHVAAAAFGKKPPLLQNLGIPPTEMIIEPYFSKGSYTPGDKYLICSDGLTDMVPEEEIAEIVMGKPIGMASKLLLDKALRNGGKDNVTLIVLEIKKSGIFSTI